MIVDLTLIACCRASAAACPCMHVAVLKNSSVLVEHWRSTLVPYSAVAMGRADSQRAACSHTVGAVFVWG